MDGTEDIFCIYFLHSVFIFYYTYFMFWWYHPNHLQELLTFGVLEYQSPQNHSQTVYKFFNIDIPQ